MNADLDLPYALIQLAEAYALRGDVIRARTVLQDAIECANRNADLWALSEVYRMLGDLAMQADPSVTTEASVADREDDAEVRRNAAEGYYLRALEIAHEQGARSFELRAAVSIGKVMERDGRIDEAAELVSPLRKLFEGQKPTPDTADADMLLGRLRSASVAVAQRL
jgi:tetratricopeptide (TPR) repeat protein